MDRERERNREETEITIKFMDIFKGQKPFLYQFPGHSIVTIENDDHLFH